MKFALHFGNFAFSDPEGARRLVRLAEAAGFDSVFAVEHVVFPDNYTSVYPYAPGGRLPGGPTVNFPDPLIWLTWVAAATTRLRFMTAVMILPQRNPLVLAKEVATLDYLSGGRIELGIGVGWLKRSSRRSAFRSSVAASAPMSMSQPCAHCGPAMAPASWATSEIRQGQLQSEAGCEIGADRRRWPLGSGCRRAGRLGDGFFPSIGAQVDTMPLLDVVRRSAEQAGRDPAMVELILGCPGALTNSGSDPRAAVEERIARGAGRLALPVTAFRPISKRRWPASARRSSGLTRTREVCRDFRGRFQGH